LASGSLRRPRKEELKISKKSRQNRLWAQCSGVIFTPEN